eukprot:SAG22_NODE_22000_length_252_cov_0.679739_1_plen_42_part_01
MAPTTGMQDGGGGGDDILLGGGSPAAPLLAIPSLAGGAGAAG